ncbi:GNAT family N-acetyltransferase [Cyanothece sp. BG0011]|uniref:GNAT family N-acetyltransferase n=1 Tax=Cyanothece sp. BG0011 TaxID=2082950 RepID=UPI000D1D7A28|nr:GNAT family N-acetyltransferase [Cyanothece sp. BG0011]
MKSYRDFLIRDWQERDREEVIQLIALVLDEYGLSFEPNGADVDVVEVKQFYQKVGGQFWVVELNHKIVGTAGYYPISRGDRAVEIRKMYLLPSVRKKGLGTYLLQSLELEIVTQGYQQIWIETASCLTEAIKLYEKSNYQRSSGVETPRCDRVYLKVL